MREFDKFQTVIQRPGMYLIENDLRYAIAFFSGLNHGLNEPLAGFKNWLEEEYFENPQAFAWEVLVPRLESCSTGDEQGNVNAFLGILDRYISQH